MTLPPQVDAAIKKVDTFMGKYPTLCQYEKLKDIETQTGYSKVYFFLFAVLSLATSIYGLGGAKLVTDLVSFVYPAYMSFKSIDSADTTDHIQWLTYWVVFSGASIFETVFSFLPDYIPFYFILKVFFFIWLYHPKFLGARMVYAKGIKPLIMPHLNAMQKTAAAPEKKTE